MMNYCVLGFQDFGSGVMQSFDLLPDDNYLLNSSVRYRKRCYSSAVLRSGGLIWNDRISAFSQSKKNNRYVGGVARIYSPVDSKVLAYLEKKIVFLALEELPECHYSIGVHQIRVTADDNNMGKPAPEGIHQDGFDFVMVVCFAASNTAGGNSLLMDAKEHSRVFYDKILQPGECLLFDDRKFAHYVSPVVPKLPGECYRDVFVVTYKKEKTL